MRPACSATMMKVGLVTGPSTPSSAARPWMKQVFPAPRSPLRASTVPGVADRAIRAARACVSSMLAQVTVTWLRAAAGPVTPGVPSRAAAVQDAPDRRWYGVGHVPGDEAGLAPRLRGEIARQPVKVHGGAQRLACRDALSEETTGDPGQHVPGATGGHARVARRVQRRAAVGMRNDSPRALQRHDGAALGRETAGASESVRLHLGDSAAKEPRRLARMRRQ